MNEWLNLRGKVAIVTGGSSGIGASIVNELCELGVMVTNADLNEGNFFMKILFLLKRMYLPVNLSKMLSLRRYKDTGR